ncbi:MAG TPA: glutamate--tRNA ligase family protein, partial [Acidobacteriaceae bacterium]
SKISKRKNPVSVTYYQQSGYLPAALLNFLGLMGGGMPAGGSAEGGDSRAKNVEAEIFSLAQMQERFDFAKISLGGPVFDLTKLKWLNGEYIRRLTPAEFLDALRETIFSDDYLARIAPLVQTRVETLANFGDMADFFFSDDVIPTPEVFIPKKKTLEETLAFAAEQLAVLEATDFSTEALEPALKKLGEEKQWAVKDNFMLLRAIVTGSTASPPLLESLIVFGKARTLDRMRRFLEAHKKLGVSKK